MKRASFIVLFVTVLFLLPTLTHVGNPAIVESSGITPMRKTSANAEGGTLYSGSGAARTATLKGLTTNETAGPLHIDSSSSGFGSVDLPAGWTGTNLRVDIPYSTMWVDRDPINNDLDDYHNERWVGMGYDTSTVEVPDEWTLIKQETSGTSHSDHPEHGVFEMNSDSDGVGGSRGWRFDAEYGAGVTLASTDEIYFSQMINIPRRALYSVHITFLYNVTANTDLQNQTYVFVRFGDYETKFYVHESGSTRNAWLIGDVVIPWSAYENITTPESLPFDIGIGTDLSGSQTSGYDSYTYIDEIYIDFEVSPFSEQVNLKANNTAIGGMTSGSVSPYVPDSANRDCTDNPSTGVDLNGYDNQGNLSVGVITGYNTWESGFQFPLSIPQGAIITSAYIEVESAANAPNYVDMRLHASDEDTVTAFSSGTPHLEDRFDWVNTSVDWDVTGWVASTRYSSPDITRLVQKVISRSGWSTGNYICIMLEYMYSSNSNYWQNIKGTSHYDGADLARLFVNYIIPQEDTVSLSGSWSGSDTVAVEFTTNSSIDVMIEPSLYLNVTDTIDTLDNEQNTGTSFSVVNNSLAYWTANVLVSPPSGVSNVNLSLSMHDNWTFLNATDPDGDDRSSDVAVVDTVLSMSSTAIDISGIWKFVFSGTNHVSDLQMGIGAGSYGDTVTFNVGDSAKFKGTAKIVGGSAMRLLLTDPSGQLFYASDDTSQGAGGDFEWTGITVTSSWDAGIWYADVEFNDTAGVNPTEVGTYQRAFTVKHDTSLTLQSPGDAINDQLSARVAGEMLYVEVQLVDDDNSETITGATVTMNWTVLGVPTDITLEDYGTGDYGVALNTSDLGDAKRWRIEIDSYRQYYNNATTYFDLDLSHETAITYETPPSTPIGDDFTVKITVRDSFNGNPIIGATITSDRTIIGLPTDHANGSYTITLDGSGLGAGSYVYQINATPSETYLLESTINITFTLRNIYTAIYGVGGNSVSTPYEFDTSMTITYNDTDHSFTGITGASNSVENPVGITASVTEISDGAYSVSIGVGTASPGTYLINVTLSRANYHDATIIIRLVLSPHDTYIVVDFDSTIPWGVDSSFDVTWYDADAGGEVSASLQNVTVVSATKGTQGPFGSLVFTLDVDGWTVGEFELNVSVYSSSVNYGHAWTLVTLTVRAHHTTLTAVVDDATPWGSDTDVTVVFWDTDTDSQVPITNVTSITYNPTGYSSQSPSGYSPTLITSTWTVEVVSTGISVICVDGSKYYDSASSSFDITIRAHHTTLTAVVDDATPWGSDTGVTVVFWDTDTDSQVPITNVTSITYNPTGYSSQGFLDYSPTLITSTWTVEVVSTGISVICVDGSNYYDSASNSFDITIRAHHTTVTALAGTSTPWGSDTNVVVVFWDLDTDSQVPITNVTSITYNPTGYSSQGFLDYSPTLTTSTWTVEVVSTGISVICADASKYYDSTSNSFDITIRAHHTTVTALAGTSTPWGSDTNVVVVFWDTDTDSQAPISNVTSITYNPTGYSSQGFLDYSPTLTTSTWTVEVVSTGISVICVGSNLYYDPASNTFDITIRAHHTTVTASADTSTPWGSDTDVTVVFWDTDTDSQVPITNVTSITYNPTGYSSQILSGYSPTLITSTWTVEVVSTGISVICVGSNLYYDSALNTFDITIRVHHTTLTAVVDDATPWGSNTGITVVFWDIDTNSQVPIANVTSITYNPTGYSSQNPSGYSPTLITSTWTVEVVSTGISVICVDGSKYYDSASSSFDITIRAHHTTVTASAGTSTPWGSDTDVTVVFWDTDTDSQVPIANVTSITYNPTGYSSQGFLDYSPTLTTSTWTVEVVSTGISVICVGSNLYYDSASNSFDLIIRAHHTSVTVASGPITPWGSNSPVTVVFWDLDTDSEVPIANVTTNGVSFDAGALGTQTFTSYTPTLATSTWDVTVVNVDLTVTCVNTNKFYDSASNSFDLTIRAHYTSVTVASGPITPWGSNSPVTVVFWDLDTDSEVPIVNVTIDGVSFDAGALGTQAFTSYIPTLVTNTWDVAVVNVDLTVTCVDTNKYYDSATNSFDITIRVHHTTLTAVVDDTTPWGSDTDITVVFWDTDTDSQVPIANVTSITYSPTGYSSQDFLDYSPTLVTSTWTVEVVSTGISVICVDGSKYYDSASSSFDITIRAHHTTVTASAGVSTPWGSNTDVTVVLWDTDTDSQVPITNVTSITYNPTGYSSQDFLDYSPTLITSTWTVEVVSTGVSVICVDGSKYYDPASNAFDIIIREHFTSVTISANLLVPYGNDTPLTVIFWDLDTDSQVPIANVSNLAFTPSGHPVQNFGTYSLTLDTESWNVGTTSITLTATCVESNKYYELATHDFQVTIRSLWTNLYHEPTDLIFPNGDDFVIVLRVNVSESGNQYDCDPISALIQGEFTVENSTHEYIISIDVLGDGRYNLTIAASYFEQGGYTIFVTVDPTSNNHASTQLVVSFSYRPARSFLSSPNYPQVVTPYDTDVTITLNYTDVDRGLGISGATFTPEGITFYGQTYLGDGEYSITLDVSGLAKGDHEFNLTASAGDYESKMLTFNLHIRIAYTYAIPTVGALDIPIGNDPVFYVEYWDTDHDLSINGATMQTTWIHTLIATYEPVNARYRIEFMTEDTDSLQQNTVVTFNFSMGENYQFGIFNISVTLRTHNTDFRLVSAVEPTSYTGVINISVYYGDLDNNEGIIPIGDISHTVENKSGSVISLLVDDTQGDGYYIVQIDADQFTLGLQTFNITFSWSNNKYETKWLVATANIVGEDSRLTLMLASEPTPYLEFMNYTFFYSDLAGFGIDNSTYDVHIYVSFQGESVDPSLVDIREVDQFGQPGNYSIGFNNTIFDRIGLVYMNVYINWTEDVTPYYTNRFDIISVRVLARDTLVSVIPPSPTSYGENATLSFTFEDVTGGGNVPIENSSSMIVNLNLADMSMTYDPVDRIFTVSFNTSQFGAPLGQTSFTLDVTWVGVPFYANRTGRVIFITVIQRQTVLEYFSPAPTQYRDNVTFSVIWTDVTGAAATGITGANIALYDDITIIPSIYYTVTELGVGEYEIDFNTTYYANPSLYSLNVTLTTIYFYMPNVTATRSFDVKSRVTILSSEPIGRVAYNLSFEVIVYYQDLMTLGNIGNGSGYASLEILNGTDWIFSCEWIPSQGYYLLTLQSYPVLEVNRNYVLWMNMSYADEQPFYRPDQAFIPFELRNRASTIYVAGELPQSTPYLESIGFTLFYEDLDSLNGIENGAITVYKDGSPLTLGVEYQFTEVGSGSYLITVETTALNGIGITQIVVNANWTLGTPYHNNATMSLSLRVIRRETNVEIEVPPSQTRFLDNVTFTFSFTDVGTDQRVAITKADIVIYNDTQILAPSLYSFIDQGGNLYVISIDSTLLSSGLVDDHNITVFVDWNDSLSPYYSDDQTSIKVTTVNRIGSVSLGQVLVTPMNDNMTLSFDLVDEATGVGIGTAEIQFDCVEVPGLVENVDYWVLVGTGADAGNYTILLDTAVLDTQFQGGTSVFNFILDIIWIPSQSPYYQDITGLEMIGGVRLIQTSLTNAPPTPATVPYNDNVSIVITFTDLDHDSRINGAGAGISVEYKNGSIPSIWAWEFLGAGMYNVTMDTHDASGKGIKTLIIEIDLYPYQSLQVQVSFQIRNRYGLLSATVPPTIYAGDSAVVMVTLVDTDSGDSPLSGAVLTITWPDSFATSPLPNGIYRINLSTLTLDYGVEQLLIEATVSNYDITPLSLDIILKAITTVVVPIEAAIELYWGNSTTVTVFYNDTLHGLPLLDAEVSYTWAGSPGNLLATGSPGYYAVTLDTSDVNATTVVVFITAQKPNYITVTTQVTLSILPLPMAVTPVDGIFVFSLPRGDAVNLRVSIIDSVNGVPVEGATVYAFWSFINPENATLTDLGGGIYQYTLDTDETEAAESYMVTITALKQNHQAGSLSFTIAITATETQVIFDERSESYMGAFFNWSQTIKVGVYVIAPDLNGTDEYHQWNATVTWRLGTEEGVLQENASFPLLGHFYFYFNTTNYDATVHSFTIVAAPRSLAYQRSSNTMLLRILDIPTSLSNPSTVDKMWGWSGWFNFTLWDMFHDTGVGNESYGINMIATYSWAGGTGMARYVGSGNYSVFINTTLRTPSREYYPIAISFDKHNFVPRSGTFNLRIIAIETRIDVDAPIANQIEGSTINLQVPWNDIIGITLFYNTAGVTTNDTPYVGGISNAIYEDAKFYHSNYPTQDITLEAFSDGYYRFSFDTKSYVVSGEAYEFHITLSYGNRTESSITILIEIIDVPTELVVVNDIRAIQVVNQDYVTFDLLFTDTWATHDSLGITEAFGHYSPNDTADISIKIHPHPTIDGRYVITVFGNMINETGGFFIITMSKTNYESGHTIAISYEVNPNEYDIMVATTVTYILPLAAVLIMGVILYVKVIKLPKQLRKINGQIRALRKGKIPKPVDDVRSRQEIVAELFNDTFLELELTRLASQMPEIAIIVDVPELGELLVQLSILTHLSTEELDDFKADISKMRMSEQAAFIKEVIHQEAIRVARRDGMSIDEVLEQVAEQAQYKIRGVEMLEKPSVEPVVLLSETMILPPEDADAEDVVTTIKRDAEVEAAPPSERLSDHEIKQLKKNLEKRGVPPHEIDTLLEQAKSLPRDLVDELVKSLGNQEE